MKVLRHAAIVAAIIAVPLIWKTGPAAQAPGASVPIFEYDPTFPKPLPNGLCLERRRVVVRALVQFRHVLDQSPDLRVPVVQGQGLLSPISLDAHNLGDERAPGEQHCRVRVARRLSASEHGASRASVSNPRVCA